MKTILAKSPHDSSLSLSKRYFNWKKKFLEEDHDHEDDDDEEDEAILTLTRFNSSSSDPAHQKKPISKLRYALTVFNRSRAGSGLGTRVVGTLYGHRRGHVQFAVQDDPTRLPAVLIELPTPTSVLVREMASGLVRVALECERKIDSVTMTKKERRSKKKRLLEEATWRTYCNGKKCGFAARKECGAKDWRVLSAVGPITMGAGVLPAVTEATEAEGNGAVGSEMGEVMYMRARFERVVGSRDSEAFYMMSPDGGPTGGPELSVYFLRV